MTLHNPDDPINYLASFLMQYRYNEIRNQEIQKEFDELLKLREEMQCVENDSSSNDGCVKCGVERKNSEFK